MKMGLRDANQRFSTLVKTIKDGEEVILTDRGQPIAVVTPMRGRVGVETTLNRLARAGFVRLPATSGPLGPAKPVRARGKSLSQFVTEEREAR